MTNRRVKTANTHPLRCRCGLVRGRVRLAGHATRAVCYCADCQAFAHFLGDSDSILDRFGGTDIVAVQPRNVELTDGVEHVACMSLSEGSTYRWYAACCRTPIGNTPHDVRRSHVGLIHVCLGADERDLEAGFGPVVMRINRHGVADEPPKSPAARTILAIARYMLGTWWARLSGAYVLNPFIDARTGVPMARPAVLSREDHEALMQKVVANRRIGSS